jgi:hypothetical protein
MQQAQTHGGTLSVHTYRKRAWKAIAVFRG